MLYKFKSKVTSDVIMLEPNGQEILQIIGKFSAETPHKGIIQPEDMPLAIQKLEEAIAKADSHNQENQSHDMQEDSRSNAPQSVQLHQRAAPFLELLKRCRAQQHPIVWGV